MLFFVLTTLFFQINIAHGYYLRDGWTESDVVGDDYWHETLGSSTNPYTLEITVIGNISVDLLFMDIDNYYKYDSGSAYTYFSTASKLNSSSISVTYTTTPEVQYVLVIDNQDGPTGGGNYTGPANIMVRVGSTGIEGPGPGINSYPVIFIGLFTVFGILIILKRHQAILNKQKEKI